VQKFTVSNMLPYATEFQTHLYFFFRTTGQISLFHVQERYYRQINEENF